MRLQRLTATAAVLLAISMATPIVFAQGAANRSRPAASTDRTARTAGSGNQNSGGQVSSSPSGGERRGVAVSRSGGGNQGNPAPSVSGDRSTNGSANRSGVAPGSNNSRIGVTPGNDGNRSSSGSQGTGRVVPQPGSAGRAVERREPMPRANPAPPNPGFNNPGNNNRNDDNRSYNNWNWNDRNDNNRNWNAGWGYRYGNGSWNDGNRRSWWRDTLRFVLGVTIFAGNPYPYRFEYGWRPAFDYRYTMRSGVVYGGLALYIEPARADVYIDGEYVGVAGNFGGQPVPVVPGIHRVELYADGYAPAALDIRVMPGQVVPYRGALRPLSYFDRNGYYDNNY